MKRVFLIVFAVPLLAVALRAGTVGDVSVGATRAVEASSIPCLDELDAPEKWTAPIYQYRNPATGNTWFENGILTIRREPVGKWSHVSAKRVWTVDPKSGLWCHVCFRIKEMLLGADLYVVLRLDNEMILQAGVNGEQHWLNDRKCQPKQFDDELFWGADVITGEENGKRTDIRVGLPRGVQLRYTDWTLLSMGYEIIDGTRRIRLFVNGHEIVYRDLDRHAPAGAVDNRVRTECLRAEKPVLFSVELSNFSDGNLYADTSVNKGKGVRRLSAFAAQTPARPHVSDPALAEPCPSDMQFDFVLVHPPAKAGKLASKLNPYLAGTPLGALLATCPPVDYVQTNDKDKPVAANKSLSEKNSVRH